MKEFALKLGLKLFYRGPLLMKQTCTDNDDKSQNIIAKKDKINRLDVPDDCE